MLVILFLEIQLEGLKLGWRKEIYDEFPLIASAVKPFERIKKLKNFDIRKSHLLFPHLMFNPFLISLEFNKEVFISN